MANLYPYALTTSLSTSKELKTEDGTTVQVFPQQVGGLAVNVTLTGPDVTGSGPASAVPTNLSVVVTTVPGGNTAALGRARFNQVFVEGPASTVVMPAAPLTGDMVMISCQFAEDVGAIATTINGAGNSVEQPLAPASFATTVPFIDSAALLIYCWDGTGEAQWSLVASNLALATFVGALSQSPNGATTQATWFIDPANSTTTASDLNSGETSATALLTFREVVRRWGSNRPVLNQATTITWLSSPATPANDPVYVEAMGTGNLLLNGPGTTATPFLSTSIAGWSPLNTATGNPNSMTTYAGAAVGDLVVNTSRGNSRASVVAIVEGSAVLTNTQNASTPSATGATVTTWANGDSIEIFKFPTVNFIRAKFKGSAISTFIGLAIQNLTIAGIVPELGGDEVQLVEINNQSISYLFLSPESLLVNCRGGWLNIIAGGPKLNSPASPQVTNLVGSGINQASLNCADSSQNTITIGPCQFAYFITSGFGIATVSAGNVVVSVSIEMQVSGAAGLWGNGANAVIDMIAAARGASNGTFTANFTGTLTIDLNSVASGLSRTTSAGTYTWFGNIALNVANLDAAAGIAGFGGLAFSTNGAACYVNSSVP